MIFQSIRHGLGGLARFSGRDSRAVFWFYALAVVGVSFVAMALGMSVAMTAMAADMQAFAAAHPDQAAIPLAQAATQSRSKAIIPNWR